MYHNHIQDHGRDVYSFDRLKIGVFRLDLRIDGSDRRRKFFSDRTMTDFGRSWAKSPKSMTEFVFGRSIGQTVGNQNSPIESEVEGYDYH